jgi:hypothetical protein
VESAERTPTSPPASVTRRTSDETKLSLPPPKLGVTGAFNKITFGRQVLRRKVNTRVPSFTGTSETTTIEVFCECGRRLCADRVRIAVDIYEAVLESPGHYVVTTNHGNDSSQRLVSDHPGFVVVERDDH